MKIRTLLIIIPMFVFALSMAGQEMGTFTDSRDDDTAKVSFANKASGLSVRCFKD